MRLRYDLDSLDILVSSGFCEVCTWKDKRPLKMAKVKVVGILPFSIYFIYNTYINIYNII